MRRRGAAIDGGDWYRIAKRYIRHQASVDAWLTIKLVAA